MSMERKNVGIKTTDFKRDEVWNEITKTFIQNPEAVQEITFTDGPLSGKGFMLSMHKEKDGSGYLQVDNVTDFTLGTIFMNYCMEKGEVLTGGIYRFHFDTIEGANFLSNS